MKIDDTIIVGDRSNGILYQISPDVYDEDGDPIVTECHFAITGYPYGMSVNRLYINAQRGVGLNSTDQELANPELMIDVSEDGGRTFTIQRTAPLGALGRYDQRVTVDMLGAFDERGARIRVSASAAVARVINSAAADIEAMAP